MRSLSTRTAGLLILALGAWGGLVPFIGHYFHFALGPDKSWAWTTGRLYLSVLPAAAAVLGGLMLIGAGWRPSARLGALLAIAAGIWFAIGPDVSHLWNAAGAQGAAHGSKTVRVLEMLAYHSLLGSLLAALGGYALPRFVAAPVAAAEPAAGRRGTERRLARDEALAGGGAGLAERERERERERELEREREPATTTMPAGGGAVAAEHERELEREREREPATTAMPAGGAAGAREAETAATPAETPRPSAREPEFADAPAADPGATETRDAPPVEDRPPVASAAGEGDHTPGAVPTRESIGAPHAEGAGEFGGAAPGPTSGAAPGPTSGTTGGSTPPPTAPDTDTNGTRTVKRRRGGLLSGFLSRR